MPVYTDKPAGKSSRSNHALRVFALATVLLSAVFLYSCDKEEEPTTLPSTTEVTTEAPAPRVLNTLTGLPGREEAVGKRPLAVVVNNAAPARPQWGLCSPDILIEGLVEGGTSRMLWLYADTTDIPDKVGSMRSARHDFVEIAEGFDAVFVHWGRSIYAESAMKTRGTDHIDGNNSSGTYFFRDKTRAVDIEHRGYTTRSSLEQALVDKQFRTDIGTAYTTPFAFADKTAPRTPSGDPCAKVAFAFSSGYRCDFRFNAEDGLYYHYFNEKARVQDGGQQVTVTNVLVLYTGIKSMNDSAGCIDMDLTGGSGLLVTNGASETITWKKGGPTDGLKLFAADGSDLVLNAGKSYIGFVPLSQKGMTKITSAS